MPFDDRATQGDGGKDLVSPFYSLDKRPLRKTIQEELQQERGLIARALAIVWRFFQIRDRKIDANKRLAEALRDITDPTFLANLGVMIPAAGNLHEARLSTNVSDPIDAVNTGNLYLHRWNGQYVSLWDGSKWTAVSVPATPLEYDLAASGLSLDTSYDAFLYLNGGAIDWHFEEWSTDSSRSPNFDIEEQDGVWVLTGDKTRKYVGTFRTRTITNPQIAMTNNKRVLWNAYNRVPVVSTFRDFGPATVTHAASGGWERLSAVSGVGDWELDIIAGGTAREYIEMDLALTIENAALAGEFRCQTWINSGGAPTPNGNDQSPVIEVPATSGPRFATSAQGHLHNIGYRQYEPIFEFTTATNIDFVMGTGVENGGGLRVKSMW